MTTVLCIDPAARVILVGNEMTAPGIPGHFCGIALGYWEIFRI